MNRAVAILTIVAAILLLSPYLGIDFFSSRPAPTAPPGAPQSVAETTSNTSAAKARPQGKQTMVEDLLSPAAKQDARQNKRLSDIESLLQDNGQNK